MAKSGEWLNEQTQCIAPAEFNHFAGTPQPSDSSLHIVLQCSIPMNKAQSVEQYIESLPAEVRQKVQQMRSIVCKAAPHAEECISYGMPALRGRRVLEYYAAAKNHIGFYPTGSGVAAFKHKLNDYKHSKGAIQFALDTELPKKLITEIVKFRLKEDGEK